MQKTSERFDRAMKALVKGYLKGTLEKGSCTSCAVGNMVAAGCGFGFDEDNIWTTSNRKLRRPSWNDVFATNMKGDQQVTPHRFAGAAKEEIDATGYSWQELAKVEKAFEQATTLFFSKYYCSTPEEIDADQLAGLHAVVNVLCEIEGISDPEPYKAQFDKTLALS